MKHKQILFCLPKIVMVVFKKDTCFVVAEIKSRGQKGTKKCAFAAYISVDRLGIFL